MLADRKFYSTTTKILAETAETLPKKEFLHGQHKWFKSAEHIKFCMKLKCWVELIGI